MGTQALLGVEIFFLILTSVVVALRLWVRLKMKKAVFGWDDIFLTMSYVRFAGFDGRLCVKRLGHSC